MPRGGYREGAGRKPEKDKSIKWAFRIKKADLEEIEKYSKKVNLTMTDFIKESVKDKIKKIIRKEKRGQNE